ncbi:MAG: PAS domain-containing protein [Thermodesulfobacteriota bacterium]
MWTILSNPIKKFTSSLSFKLSFYAGFIMFLAVVAFAYHTIFTQEDSLLDEKTRAAIKDTEIIKAAIWNGMMTKDRQVIREIVAAVGKEEGFRDINIYDHRGVLHYTSRAGQTAEAASMRTGSANPLLVNLDTNTSLRYRFIDRGNVLNIVNPLNNNASCATAGCHADPSLEPVLGALEVNLPIHDLRMKINDHRRKTLVFAVALFLVVSSILGLVVIFGVLPPIKRLQRNARNMAKGHYAPTIANYGSDEIADLARTFDDMSREINLRTAKLDESRRFYKDLFHAVPCYLNIVDPDYRIVRANRAFTDEFGDHTGSFCYQVFKGQVTPCRNCQVQKTFADGLSHRGEQIWTTEGGTRKVHVVVHTSPILDEEGKVSQVLEMSVDITRLKNLQAQLEKKEQEFKTLFENVPCYLSVVDKSYRIAFFNKRFVQDFGDCWGRHCYTAYKGRETKCSNCTVEATFADGSTHSSEELWHLNGRDRHIILQTAPILDERGEVVAVMEMFNDITELRLLQNELSTLGETIAGMSHDVKNILSGLEGGVYVVDSGLRQGREERVRQGWEMVKRNVEKVSDLVKDILYASKEREPEYRECNPGEILTEVHDLYQSKARDYGIELVKDFEQHMGNGLLDPKGIHSAVSNLIANAIAACRSSGKPSPRHIILHAGRIDTRLVIKVIDDGAGMSQEVRENLFRKFYSTKGAKGTGLGLVVTQKIVEEHKGTIAVESAEGEGTTFIIEIPLMRPEKKTA